MESIRYLIDHFYAEIAIGFLVFNVILAITFFVQNSKINRLKKKYRSIFKGQKVDNIETMLLSNREILEELQENCKSIDRRINANENAIRKAYTKTSILKYDAFTGLAGKLSFVFVMLNEENSGLILNGIYSSEGHYLYIKDVQNGLTDKELSKEEKQTLERLLQ